MKPGSIHAAFSSKENLYMLALERHFARSRAGFRGQLARAASPLSALADHFRSFARLAPDDMSRQACILTKTLVDTRTTDPAIAAMTRDYLTAMQDEFAAAFFGARNADELASGADPTAWPAVSRPMSPRCDWLCIRVWGLRSLPNWPKTWPWRSKTCA